jgi:hypothetical protein
MWELACQRCRQLGPSSNRVDAIAGKPALTGIGFHKEHAVDDLSSAAIYVNRVR